MSTDKTLFEFTLDEADIDHWFPDEILDLHEDHDPSTKDQRGKPQIPSDRVFLFEKISFATMYQAMHATPRKASSACLYVYLILRYREKVRRKIEKSDVFDISLRMFEKFGLHHATAQKALKALRAAGYISANRVRGKRLRVKILLR
jgi:DNA-binding transcriptional ArsR family regulator